MSKNSKNKRRKWSDIKPPAKRTAGTDGVEVVDPIEVAAEAVEYVGRHRAEDTDTGPTYSGSTGASYTDSGSSSGASYSGSGSSSGASYSDSGSSSGGYSDSGSYGG